MTLLWLGLELRMTGLDTAATREGEAAAAFGVAGPFAGRAWVWGLTIDFA